MKQVYCIECCKMQYSLVLLPHMFLTGEMLLNILASLHGETYGSDIIGYTWGRGLWSDIITNARGMNYKMKICSLSLWSDDIYVPRHYNFSIYSRLHVGDILF